MNYQSISREDCEQWAEIFSFAFDLLKKNHLLFLGNKVGNA